MIKKWLFLLLSGISIGGFAQELEQRLEYNTQVDMVIITPDMFELINEVNTDPERSVFFKGLTYFAMFSATDHQAAQDIYQQALDYASQKGMKLLLKVKDADKDTYFYYIPADQKGYAREIVLLIFYPGQDKTRLWHIKGHINLKKISLLALQRTQIDTSVLKEAEKKVE